MKTYTIASAAASNAGNLRCNNEDNFFLNGQTLDVTTQGTAVATDESDSGLYAVCDGMGGEAFGEVASAIAVDTLREYYQRMLAQGTTFDTLVQAYTGEANVRICAEIEKNHGKRIGTTFAVLHIKDGTAYAHNIGDSRVYLLRGGRLTQLSQNHTQIRQLVELGILTAENARTHPDRHKLTQHLGIPPDEMIIQPFAANPLSIMDGDTFLLCSDGLTDMLEDSEIEAIMAEHPSPKDIAEKLVEAALFSGGKDNVTVIVVK